MLLYSSTQPPTEIQHLVAAALDIPDATVTVELRRLGGGFGGKETQAAVYAIAAALLARATGRPVKLRADRDDDIVGTGKRHDFLYEYDAGFDQSGHLEALDLMLASRCGISADLSGAVNDRAVFHCDNAYFLPNLRITSHRCKTNTVSNTAFRGFGGPQGMFAIEGVIAAIARRLGLDPLDVRLRNLYGEAPRNVTHYGMTLRDNVLPELLAELGARPEYRARRVPHVEGTPGQLLRRRLPREAGGSALRGERSAHRQREAPRVRAARARGLSGARVVIGDRLFPHTRDPLRP